MRTPGSGSKPNPQIDIALELMARNFPGMAFSQQQIARFCGCQHSYIRKLEHQAIAKIRKALGLAAVILIAARAISATITPPPVQLLASWSYPTNIDIAGFKVWYGAAPGEYTNSVSVPKAARQAMLPNLIAGVQYFAVYAAIGTNGTEGDWCAEQTGVAGQQQYMIEVESSSILTGPWSNAYSWTNIAWTTNPVAMPTNQFWRLRVWRVQ